MLYFAENFAGANPPSGTTDMRLVWILLVAAPTLFFSLPAVIMICCKKPEAEPEQVHQTELNTFDTEDNEGNLVPVSMNNTNGSLDSHGTYGGTQAMGTQNSIRYSPLVGAHIPVDQKFQPEQIYDVCQFLSSNQGPNTLSYNQPNPETEPAICAELVVSQTNSTNQPSQTAQSARETSTCDGYEFGQVYGASQTSSIFPEPYQPTHLKTPNKANESDAAYRASQTSSIYPERYQPTHNAPSQANASGTNAASRVSHNPQTTQASLNTASETGSIYPEHYQPTVSGDSEGVYAILNEDEMDPSPYAEPYEFDRHVLRLLAMRK